MANEIPDYIPDIFDLIPFYGWFRYQDRINNSESDGFNCGKEI